ncbi:hypothetical protein JT306_01540 [Salmonella enterica subsp. enterica serovar Kentucky]|nr:hypothetical protein [Salmonella enterica subsp. enterica serovar Kentucky]
MKHSLASLKPRASRGFFIAFPVHECFNCLNYFTLLLLSERSNTSALSHHVMAVSQAKTGIYFTIRIRFAALFTVSSRQLAGKDPHFREMSLKNTAI